jgi:alanine racemase
MIACALSRKINPTQLPTHFRTLDTEIPPANRRQATDFNGGRVRTRTVDLLRVKQANFRNSGASGRGTGNLEVRAARAG